MPSSTSQCKQNAKLTLLDVVVGEGPAILQLLAGKDEPLLVWGDALLVLDLGLDILDGVRGLHLEGDGLAREGLDEDLHLVVGGGQPRPEMRTQKERAEKETRWKATGLARKII